jgi:hypothetical protein
MNKKIQEEMLSIPDPKGNANQNHVKIIHHSFYNGYHQEQKQQMLARMTGKKEPSCTADGYIN